MAAESIGVLIPTAIPGYADAADIQAALRVYHYGEYAYNPANTSPGSLVTPSMAKTIYDIQQDIVDLENRPSSGGDVANTAPVPGDFTPAEIPNGYIWVDQDGTIGGQPISATSVFTNSVPTSDLSTGVIWVDKDPTSITANPFIPQAVISAKGDILVGTANDTASVLNTASTNGYILAVNSATTSGLEWIANDTGDITAVTSGTGISVTSSTGPIPSVAVDTAVVATTNNTLTLTNKTLALGSNTVSGTIAEFNTALTDANFATLAGTETLSAKTLTSPVINQGILVSPEERMNIVASAANGTINMDTLTSGSWYYTSNATGNWVLNVRGDGSTTLNSILTTGDSITVAFLAPQGATAYYNTSLEVDGTASGVTVEWQGGTAPAAGNVSGIDVYLYNIIKTASATYTVLASQTKFA
jgi:hypothetical protein